MPTKKDVVDVTITYDKIDKSFTIQDINDHSLTYAKTITLALKILENMGYTASQAREGLLRATFNDGNAISMANVEKMATLINDKKRVAVTFEENPEIYQKVREILADMSTRPSEIIQGVFLSASKKQLRLICGDYVCIFDLVEIYKIEED